tara:strand:- start:17789 stop:19960 length:2172 start_codon:yes stop_codon:yes gene_type:complete
MSKGIEGKALWIALAVSIVLSAAFGVALYLNEDWRTSEVAIIEETVDEDGEVVRKVKVEKPEPNEKQVREIARNQEKKKREELKKRAKKMRKTIIEIEEIVETRRDILEKPDLWDEFAVIAREQKDRGGHLYYRLGKSRFLQSIPGGKSAFKAVNDLASRHAARMKILAIQNEVIFAESTEALEEASRVLDKAVALQNLLQNSYNRAAEAKEPEKSKRDLDKRVEEIDEFVVVQQEYVNRMKLLLLEDNGIAVAEVEDAKLDSPDPLASDFPEAMEDLVDEEDESLVSEVLNEEEDPLETTVGTIDEVQIPEEGDATLADSEILPTDEFGQDPEDGLPSEEELDQMDTSELYQSIQEMAVRADEAFVESQATELAGMKQVSLEEAREQVYQPQTDTGPDLAEKLSQNQPSTADEFKEFNESLDQAVSSSERMTREAMKRRDRVAGNEASPENASQTAEQLREALNHDASVKARMAMAGSNRGRDKGNLQDLRSLMKESYLGAQGGGGRDDDTRRAGLNSGYDQSAFQHINPSEKSASRLKLNTKQAISQALPGRRFDIKSERKGWIFLDTWYIIGPWQLPNGPEFEKTFPPETLVDLDATYEGKIHPKTKEPIELEWRFFQSQTIRVKPPDELSSTVYFAYTEVFCEAAMDVVVAVASDDRAKLWINDLVVFQDVGLSGWQLDEGFRRIVLKPGYNSVLLRLENGPAVANFSVLMCPSEALAR